MSRFCFNCGAQIRDEKAFCCECGARQSDAWTAEPDATDQAVTYVRADDQDRRKQRTRLVIALASAGVLIVAVLAIVFWANIFGHAYEKPIKDMLGGMQSADYDRFSGAFVESARDKIDALRMSKQLSKNKFMTEYVTEKFLRDEYGYDMRVGYRITASEQVSSLKLKRMKDTYALPYIPTEGYKLNVTLTYTGYEGGQTENEVITVAKIGGTWYVIASPFDLVTTPVAVP